MSLELALTCSGFAIGLLSGVWLGFRVVSRDAALLAALDKRVAGALGKSTEALARAELLEANVAEHLDALDRKRRQASTERQRADQAVAKKEAAPEAEATPIPEALTGRERRRALAARLRGVA